MKNFNYIKSIDEIKYYIEILERDNKKPKRIISSPITLDAILDDIYISSRLYKLFANHFNIHGYSSGKITLKMISDISKKELLKNKGVGNSTYSDLRSFCVFYGIYMRP